MTGLGLGTFGIGCLLVLLGLAHERGASLGSLGGQEFSSVKVEPGVQGGPTFAGQAAAVLAGEGVKLLAHRGLHPHQHLRIVLTHSRSISQGSDRKPVSFRGSHAATSDPCATLRLVHRCK